MGLNKIELDRLEEFLEGAEGRFTSTRVLNKNKEMCHIDLSDTGYCYDSNIFKLEDAQMQTSDRVIIYKDDITGFKDCVECIEISFEDITYIIGIN